MGYSFAAGTVDGPGAFSFQQGTTSSNPMWNFVRDVLAKPTEEDIECQAPKPILLATGRVSKSPRDRYIKYKIYCLNLIIYSNFGRWYTRFNGSRE